MHPSEPVPAPTESPSRVGRQTASFKTTTRAHSFRGAVIGPLFALAYLRMYSTAVPRTHGYKGRVLGAAVFVVLMV